MFAQSHQEGFLLGFMSARACVSKVGHISAFPTFRITSAGGEKDGIKEQI